MAAVTAGIAQQGTQTDAMDSIAASGDLSADRFSAIVNSLKRDNGIGETGDQRRRPRFDLRARATIIPLRESCHPGSLAVLVRDLSPSGMGFLYERPMSLDEQFALLLPRSGDTPAVVLCEVACWQPLAKNVYGVGARFVRILRDGGEQPLPIEINLSSQNFAPMPQYRAKAS